MLVVLKVKTPCVGAMLWSSNFLNDVSCVRVYLYEIWRKWTTEEAPMSHCSKGYRRFCLLNFSYYCKLWMENAVSHVSLMLSCIYLIFLFFWFYFNTPGPITSQAFYLCLRFSTIVHVKMSTSCGGNERWFHMVTWFKRLAQVLPPSFEQWRTEWRTEMDAWTSFYGAK